MKHLWILLALLFAGNAAFGQINAYDPQNTSTRPDTFTVKSTTVTTGGVIVFTRPDRMEGKASLFIAGDTLAANSTKLLQVELRQGDVGAKGDTIWGAWTLVDSVSIDSFCVNNLDVFDGGKGSFNGKQLDLASKVNIWQEHALLQFRFFYASGSQVDRWYSLLRMN